MTQHKSRYTYQFNGRDGTFDLIQIINPNGKSVAALFYWDEPNTDEAARVEESARLICEHLNHWYMGGDDVSPCGWVDIQYATLRYRISTALHAVKHVVLKKLRPSLIGIHAALARRRQIAIIWSIDDVREVRPDLNDDQAWEVLRRFGSKYDCEAGMTWLGLELTANDMFPEPDETNEGERS
jgi:hypothetical protein